MNPVLSYLVNALVPLIVATGLFAAAFRLRRHRVPLLTSFLLAASPMFLAFIPFPIPSFLRFFFGGVIACVLMMKYTDVDLLPEGIIIITSVELASALSMNLVHWIL